MPIRMSETQVNETMARATRAAAADPRLRGGIKREKDLVNAIRDALGPDQTTKELQPKGLKGKWRRIPGGIDLVLHEVLCMPTQRPSLAALMEMKIHKLDESLWDLIKTATLVGVSLIGPCGYLVYAADRSKFDDPDGENCSPLFQDKGVLKEWRTFDLIKRYPEAWSGLLKGSSKTGNPNFPLMAPSIICTELIAIAPIEGTSEQEIRVVRVWAPTPDEEVHFDNDGWPERESFEPTTGHQPITWDSVRDEFNKTVNATAASDPEERNASRYPKRFSDPWLATNVPDMPSDEYSLLIAELKRRGWRKDEIVERVEAHRH